MAKLDRQYEQTRKDREEQMRKARGKDFGGSDGGGESGSFDFGGDGGGGGCD